MKSEFIIEGIIHEVHPDRIVIEVPQNDNESYLDVYINTSIDLRKRDLIRVEGTIYSYALRIYDTYGIKLVAEKIIQITGGKRNGFNESI
jgi:hypothetical protein